MAVVLYFCAKINKSNLYNVAMTQTRYIGSCWHIKGGIDMGKNKKRYHHRNARQSNTKRCDCHH